MSDKAFLRAIASDPADDTARLVYADFLKESGDPTVVAPVPRRPPIPPNTIRQVGFTRGFPSGCRCSGHPPTPRTPSTPGRPRSRSPA